MKVRAKWKYYNGKKYEINESEITYCCNGAEKSTALTFGEVDSVLNRNEHVNISSCFAYPEGAVYDEEAISFCPFCGAKIEIDIEY